MKSLAAVFFFSILGAMASGQTGLTYIPSSSQGPARLEFPHDDEKAHFKKFLDDCLADEVRCVYFFLSGTNTAKLMTINRVTGTTWVQTQSYNHGGPSPYNIWIDALRLKRVDVILKNLPLSAENSLHEKTLSVAFWTDGKPHTHMYALQTLPSQIKELCGMAGRYLTKEDQSRTTPSGESGETLDH